MNVCILSSERSGSNLLRLILDAHSEISGPAAPHVARQLGPYLHLYGDLERDDNLAQLAEDVVTLARVHPSPWPEEVTPERLLGRLERRSFWHVFDALYAVEAELRGKRRWCSKENNLFDYAFEIAGALPETRFLYLARDGRDFACSMRRAPGGRSNWAVLARLWREEQARCLRAHAQLAPRGASLAVRYEDLLDEPEAVVDRICGFLGVAREPAMLAFHEGASAKEAAGSSEYWQNLSRPLLRGNYGKYKKLMTRGQVRRFEAIAGYDLERLGYACDNEPGDRELRGPLGWLHSLQDSYFWWRGRYRFLAEPGRAERAEAVRCILRRLRRSRERSTR